MKTMRIITMLGLLAALFMTSSMNAQRRVVVKTPGRTVVRTTNARVVYRRPVPVVRVVRTLPATTVVIKRNGLQYHYYNGLYYRSYNGSYVVVAAPYGVRIKVLPVGYHRIVYLGTPYFYYQGNYYVEVSGSYKTVEAPENIVVSELPEEAEQVDIDGKMYYEYSETLYKVVTTPEGKAFKAVGNLKD